MPNPTITPYTTPGAAYQVGQSDTAFYDVELTDLSDPAEFIVTAPAGAQVHVWTGAPLLWDPAGGGTALLTSGTWQTTANVGSWQITVSPGGAVTDPALVTVSSGSPAGGPLRVRVRNIGAGTATLQAQFNAATRRVVADPSIIGTPGPIQLPVVERTPLVTLAGTPGVSKQQGPTVPAAFGADPVPRGDWTRTTNNFAFVLTPSGTSNATFTAPGVIAATVESFQFRAYYDFDSNSAFTAGEPDNTEPVNVTIQPANHRMVLVLDRSGSMSAGLGGGSESRWNATRRAAHVWLDLFSAFRAATGQKAGFITFEDDTCGWGPAATASDVTFRDPVAAADAVGLSDLSTFATLNEIQLGTPQSCTPIGDALVKAFQGLTSTPLGDLDACSIMLLTDGHENSGATTIKNALPPGATQTINQVLNTQYAGLHSKLRIYSLGAGNHVNEDTLNNLPAVAGLGGLTGGYYNLVNNTSGLLSTFAQFMAHSVDGQAVMVVYVSSPSHYARFVTNSGEHRVAVIVPWTTPADTLQISERPVPGSGAWNLLSATGVTLRKRATHAILVVDLAAALGGATTAREWKVEHISGGVAQPITAALAMVDLHLSATVTFDKRAYKTGEPIVVTCTLLEGGEPIVGAKVVAVPEVPEEGLGTYLATKGAALGGATTFPSFMRSKRSEPLKEHMSRSDPATPKGLLYQYFLSVDGIQNLPRADSTFEDGTDELFDDGAHHDGEAGDGVYANRFVKTHKEGTCTFGFLAIGKSPSDGSEFSRMITVSTWVGTSTDWSNSPTTFKPLASPGAGLRATMITILPRDARGEFFGPFREEDVRIDATAGSFSGPVESRLDGSYVRTLVYKRDEDPVVTVTVGDEPAAVQPVHESCWSLFVRLVKCILRKLMFWKK